MEAAQGQSKSSVNIRLLDKQDMHTIGFCFLCLLAITSKHQVSFLSL